MILPIVAYGYPVLRKKAQEITADYPNLKKLIENMFETMYNAHGVGLAAPQVNLSIRLFVVDGSPMDDEETPMADFKKVFINPVMLSETGKEWAFREGCLSIPDVREDVFRNPDITIQYFDENFEQKTETFQGMQARIIQHEYDHLEGILFTDHISKFRLQLLKTRLSRISKGAIDHDYPMKFPK
ncbi:MAG: peptide deformylase [Bacteroidia bacterium]